MRITTPLNPDVAAAGRGVPYAAAFIDKAVQDALLSIVPTRDRPHLKYAVRNFWVLQYVQLFNNAPRMARLQADYDAALRARGKVAGPNGAQPPPPPAPGTFGGFGGPGGGGAFGGGFQGNTPPAAVAPAGAGSNPAFQDRVTGESMLNDYEFEIAIAVELDPEPWQKPATVDQTAAK
jgi:hypothetical protein